MELVQFWADIATLVALLFTVGALGFTAWQVWTGRLAASANALIALNDAFRQAWLEFRNATGEDSKQYAFSDVMNLLESACAIFQDRLFVGRSGKLFEEYLCHVLILIRDSPDAKRRIEKMLLMPNTFEHVLRFLKQHRREVRNLTLPTPNDDEITPAN